MEYDEDVDGAQARAANRLQAFARRNAARGGHGGRGGDGGCGGRGGNGGNGGSGGRGSEAGRRGPPRPTGATFGDYIPDGEGRSLGMPPPSPNPLP